MIIVELYARHVEIDGVGYILRTNGQVFSKYTGKEVKQRPNPDGYMTFTAGRDGRRRSIRTHRIIAQTFLPNPNNLPEVDHLDNNRANPAVANLEWCTHPENITRAYIRGSHIGRVTGVNNPKARLSEDEVIEVRRLFDNGIMTQKQIAKQYGIGWSTVHNIVRRYTWTHYNSSMFTKVYRLSKA